MGSWTKKGATFTIYLPLTEDETEALLEKKSKVLNGNGESILLVDDDIIVLEMTSEMLERLNYRPVSRNSERYRSSQTVQNKTGSIQSGVDGFYHARYDWINARGGDKKDFTEYSHFAVLRLWRCASREYGSSKRSCCKN